MKLLATLLLPALTIITACHSDGDSSQAHADAVAANAARAAGAATGAATGSVEWEYTFEHQDARQMANRMRGFLVDTQVRITADGSDGWKVVGSDEEVALVRFLAVSFDQPNLSREHRGGTYAIEHRDARLLLNSTRGRDDWGADWIVAANSTDRWFAMIPDGDLEAFRAVLAELDRPE